MLLSFTILQLMGITLNMVVLFSLILALGMLVDGIVIGRTSSVHSTMGKSQRDAAIDGTSEVARFYIYTDYLPRFLSHYLYAGCDGRFMAYIPITVIVVLSASCLLHSLSIRSFVQDFE